MHKTHPTILITGATGKLGTVFVDHFLNKGFDVIFTSRSEEKIQDFISQRTSKKALLHGIAVDLETTDAIQHIINRLEEQALWPTTLVNNARNPRHLKMAQPNQPSRENWVGEYLLDVVIPYDLSMAIAAHPSSRLKSVVNIASMYGVVAPNPSLYENHAAQSPVHYSVAKAAVIHLTKEMAVRLSGKGIRVNAISYGGVAGRVNEAFKQRYAALCPIGRMLEDEEVAGSLEFLASDLSAGMTGHNMVVDGGWSIW